MKKKGRNSLHLDFHHRPFQAIILGFAGVILFGTFLLMLPVSSATHRSTSLHDSLFTAVSAVCVTGLVVKDTGSYWSQFGQTVILLLIQIGGLGVITVAAVFAMLSGRKIGLMQRSTMQSSISAFRVGGIVRLTRFIVKGTFLIEGIGALCMLPIFTGRFGIKGIWMAVFHSVSAFCNAGFDLLGTDSRRFVSLSGFADHVALNLIIMALIVIGGIGFVSWDDIVHQKLHFRRYRLQTKIVLTTTALLIILPAIFFYFADFRNSGVREGMLMSFFQSVTTRTAGFNTADLAGMSQASRAVMILLMLIGASPGSTAGGMKITTFVIVVANAMAVFREEEETDIFSRKISIQALRSASTVFLMYLILACSGAMLICMKDGFPLGDCLFETASAIGTVGLTLGITTKLSEFSHLILIALMFLGRVGGLTLVYATHGAGFHTCQRKLPEEMVTVG